MPDDQKNAKISFWTMIREAASDWSDDQAPQLGAALAYYTVFSLSPIVLLTLSIARMAFGGEFVQSHYATQLDSFLGNEGSAAIQSMIKESEHPGTGVLATVLSVVMLLFGAGGVFIQLKSALNRIWEVEIKPGITFWKQVRDYLFSFSMVIGIAFLFLVSLIISTIMAAMTSSLKDILPGPDIIAHLIDIIISTGIVVLLFGIIFKYLPDVEIAWRDVWFGAFVTGILFTLGKYLISLYLSTSAVSSSYGAAGSLIVILVWCYYSAQILFFGAELTQTYAHFRGARIIPNKNAKLISNDPPRSSAVYQPHESGS